MVMSDFNEYSIQVGAMLDSSSLGRIKTEIRNVTSQIKPIEVPAQIDSKILSQSLLKIRADIENAFDACLSKIFECMDKKEYFKNLIEVYRQDGSVRKVSIMKDRATGKFCFVNLTTMHVCQCRFDTFEDAIQDLEKREDVKRYSINFIDDEKSM